MFALIGVIVFWLYLSVANCETIHFTNSPSHLTKSKNFTSYKLKVPGSDSITVIEASAEQHPLRRLGSDDSWENEHVELDVAGVKNSRPPSLEVMIFNKNASATHTASGSSSVGSAVPKKMVYAPTLLDKFIAEYSSKLHGPAQYEDDRKTLLEEQGDRYNDYSVFNDRSPTQRRRYSHPYNDKEGWVTMDAVPWSKSQVSKWKPNADVKPTTSLTSFTVYRKPHITPNAGTRPSYWVNNLEGVRGGYPSQRPAFYENSNEDEDYENINLNARPIKQHHAEDKKYYYSGNDQQIETSNNNDRWYDYGFRPNFEKNQKPWNEDVLVSDYQSNTLQVPSKQRPHGGYLSESPQPQYQAQTDNRPAQSLSHQATYPSHPATYPSRGNGEWILVSTTKGYQYPHRVQRGMSLPPADSDSLTFKTHKAIKLTVLPAKRDPHSKTNTKPMTVSHDGLLEVSSSALTVEDSASASASPPTSSAELNSSDRPARNRTTTPTNRIYRAVPIGNSNSDSSAVLAAVGAGMVPATVAMLMPMVMGRKKRSISNPFSTNSNANFQIDVTRLNS